MYKQTIVAILFVGLLAPSVLFATTDTSNVISDQQSVNTVQAQKMKRDMEVQIKKVQAEIQAVENGAVKQAKEQIREEHRTIEDTIQTDRVQAREVIIQEAGELKGYIEQRRAEYQNATNEEKESLRAEFQNQREALHQNTQSLRQEVKDNALELREQFRASSKSQIEQARIVVAHKRAFNMTNRFSSALIRFDNIVERIESRLEKLEAEGVDTSSVLFMLEELKTLQAENEALLESLKATYESLLEADDVSSTKNDAKLIAQELKENMINIHSKLKEIVKAMRLLNPKTNE